MKANDSNVGVQALRRLVDTCLLHQGGSTLPLAQLLVHLYNPEYARPDIALLCRRVDANHFVDALAVMAWFRSAERPGFLHTYLDDGERKIWTLMTRFGIGPQEVLDDLARDGRYA